MAFVYLVAVITAVGSERMFWFWAPGMRTHLEVATFYAIATATGIMAMRRHRVDSWWSLMLAVPVVAYVVEGVITPVLHSGGRSCPSSRCGSRCGTGSIIAVQAVAGAIVRALLRVRKRRDRAARPEADPPPGFRADRSEMFRLPMGLRRPGPGARG